MFDKFKKRLKERREDWEVLACACHERCLASARLLSQLVQELEPATTACVEYFRDFVNVQPHMDDLQRALVSLAKQSQLRSKGLDWEHSTHQVRQTLPGIDPHRP